MKEIAYADKFAIQLFDEIEETEWDYFVMSNKMGHVSHLNKMIKLHQDTVDAGNKNNSARVSIQND